LGRLTLMFDFDFQLSVSSFDTFLPLGRRGGDDLF
jgi:hypothetical protein